MRRKKIVPQAVAKRIRGLPFLFLTAAAAVRAAKYADNRPPFQRHINRKRFPFGNRFLWEVSETVAQLVKVDPTERKVITKGTLSGFLSFVIISFENFSRVYKNLLSGAKRLFRYAAASCGKLNLTYLLAYGSRNAWK